MEVAGLHSSASQNWCAARWCHAQAGKRARVVAVRVPAGVRCAFLSVHEESTRQWYALAVDEVGCRQRTSAVRMRGAKRRMTADTAAGQPQRRSSTARAVSRRYAFVFPRLPTCPPPGVILLIRMRARRLHHARRAATRSWQIGAACTCAA